MRKTLFTTLFVSALILPLTAHADTIDDFVLTGNGETITFSLPASPPGNLSTCPTGIITSCLPGFETNFTASTLVTIDGVSTEQLIDFPTGMFLGGLSIGLNPGRLVGDQLFQPDAGDPTFLTGTFDLSSIPTPGGPPLPIDYTLTITPETAPPTVPEPSTLALLATGALGFTSVIRRRFLRV